MTTPIINQVDEARISKIVSDMENSQIHDEKELLWTEMIAIVNRNIKMAYMQGGNNAYTR